VWGPEGVRVLVHGYSYGVMGLWRPGALEDGAQGRGQAA
jgi:hypothetical protein